jgi:hypothetical protein
MVCFVTSLEANLPFAKGISIAVVNMIVMLFGGIFQPIVGWLMNSSNAPMTWIRFVSPGYRLRC